MGTILFVKPFSLRWKKSFVAYEKELFLHIGAQYIDQRANADVNDDNFMETFVRVFGKF